MSEAAIVLLVVFLTWAVVSAISLDLQGQIDFHRRLKELRGAMDEREEPTNGEA